MTSWFHCREPEERLNTMSRSTWQNKAVHLVGGRERGTRKRKEKQENKKREKIGGQRAECVHGTLPVTHFAKLGLICGDFITF